MSQETSKVIKKVQGGQHRPPMPRFLFKLVNPLMKGILNSPMHGRMSQRLMVLSYTGRKSRRRFSTPVGYVRDGEKIYVFTHSPWRTNFNESAPVTMRIQGKDVPGKALLVSDPEHIRQMIQVLIATNGPEMSQRMGFWVENIQTASLEEVGKSTAGTYFIEIKTGSGAA